MANLRLLPFLLGFVALPCTANADDPWPQFRGRHATGIGTGNPPVTWNMETGENVRWRTAIEGLGHSSPIVWGNRVFATTAVNVGNPSPSLETGWLGGTGKAAEDTGSWSWQVHCYDLATGLLVWRREAAVGEPLRKRHLKASHANCTPATDGRYVVAFFGSEGLYCFDIDGNLKWRTGFGLLHAGPYNATEYEWGCASSPVIYEGHVIVQCDYLNMSFLAILRLEDGVEVRRIPRNDVATWSTPLVMPVDGRAYIVCNGYLEMAGYDFGTGERLWFLEGGGDIPVPTPLYARGLFLLTNGHGRCPTYAVSPGARGDITPPVEGPPDAAGAGDAAEDAAAVQRPSGVVWHEPRDGSYMPTPIVVGKHLYICNDDGRLTVRDVDDGSMVYRQRVGGGATYSASAVGTDSRLYLADEAGTVRVVKTGPDFELLAENDMRETVMATPAISGDRLLIRTAKQLVCIGPKDEEAKKPPL